MIDTGSEVILVDTGVPEDFPFGEPTEDATIYVGKKIKPYIEALADLGYKPEQVSKILITHKHADHTGALGYFPNAQIICSAAEAESDEIKPFNPTVATFQDGPFYEFPASQRIADGVTYISAPGHTNGNCIVAVESDGLFYLIHGDVTYTDVAFYENKLSVVYEDKAAARETLDRCRAFCAAQGRQFRHSLRRVRGGSEGGGEQGREDPHSRQEDRLLHRLLRRMSSTR